LLGNETETANKNEIISVLLGWLDHPEKTIRDATITSLDKLNSKWLEGKETAAVISGIIDKLNDDRKKLTSKLTLLELNGRIVSFLNQSLSTTQRGIVRLSILEILSELGAAASPSIPVLLELKNQSLDNFTLSFVNKLIKKIQSFKQDSPVALPEPKKENKYEYDVAFSFANENRDYVDQTADLVIAQGYTVFYDKHEQVNLWGRNLYEHFNDVYKNKAKYCIIFISKLYAEKLWTRHEFRSAQERAFKENREYILPVRFDDSELPGLNNTVGYLDLRQILPVDLARIIVQKLLQ
jgi:hypothetical protein